MKSRCPNSKFVRKGYLKDHELTFSKYSNRWSGGVADVVYKKGSQVWGLIYEVTIKDLHLLDGFEGYPTCYNRKKGGIKTLDKKVTINAWIYYIVENTGFEAPSKKYLGIIRTAAHNYNFPIEYRKMLKDIPLAVKKKSTFDYKNLLIKNKKYPLLASKKTVKLESEKRSYSLEEVSVFKEPEDFEELAVETDLFNEAISMINGQFPDDENEDFEELFNDSEGD